MPTLIMTGKLEKSWNHWVATDDGYKSARQAVGTKDIYRGHSADAPTSIHAVSWTPSTPVWEDFMAANGEVIKEAEPIADSTQVTICSD